MSVNKDRLVQKLQTKRGMIQVVGVAVLTIFTTVVALFVYDVRKNKNAAVPLGYRAVDPSKIAKITDRSGDIVKDRYHPSKTKVPKNIDYIVIGSGISGLATAACLARVGRKVLVLEQHDRLGGCLHQYSKAFQFDTGIHYVGKPQKYAKMLQPLTSKDQQVQFVAMGSKDNGYVYDEYLIGTNDNLHIFKARANTRRQDLYEQFPSANERLAIDEFYRLQKDAERLNVFVFAGKLGIQRWLAKLLFKIGEWKYPHLWNKSARDIYERVFRETQLLGMSVMANIGDMGGKLRSNAAIILYGLFGHYKYGGFFINGGPFSVVRSMMPVIEASGGRCLANVSVGKILIENGKAVGVSAVSKKGNKSVQFRAKYGVISTVGFRNLYTKLLPVSTLPSSLVDTATQNNIQRLLNTVEPSAQHFHVFIGFDKTAQELDLPRSNRWYLQFGEDQKTDAAYDYDAFIEKFHKDPLTAPLMGFLSFPSAKNPDWDRERPGKATAIILTEIPRYHFTQWENEQHDARGDDYVSLKKQIAERLMQELLFKYFPKCTDAIAKLEIGTALSAEYYFAAPSGESYGLQCSCERYFDFELNQLLKPKQPINGLWFAGQDVISAGFASALQSGVWCAESILGYHKLSVVLSGRNLIKDLNKMDGYEHKQLTTEDYDYDQIKK